MNSYRNLLRIPFLVVAVLELTYVAVPVGVGLFSVFEGPRSLEAAAWTLVWAVLGAVIGVGVVGILKDKSWAYFLVVLPYSAWLFWFGFIERLWGN